MKLLSLTCILLWCGFVAHPQFVKTTETGSVLPAASIRAIRHHVDLYTVGNTHLISMNHSTCNWKYSGIKRKTTTNIPKPVHKNPGVSSEIKTQPLQHSQITDILIHPTNTQIICITLGNMNMGISHFH